MRVVVKHEALAVRRGRAAVSGEEVDLDAVPAVAQRSVEERFESSERVERSAEVMRQLKRDEARALMLKAEGLSYTEIGERLGWTYTKVNRCITEGRKRFMRLYEELETGVECERLAPTLHALAQGTANSEALLELRPHLRSCAGCRATVRALHASHLRSLSAFAAGLIAPARAFVERFRGRRGPEEPPAGDLQPMEHQDKLDELFRRINAGEAAVQPVAPSIAEGVGRVSAVRVNLRGWGRDRPAAPPELRPRGQRARGEHRRRGQDHLDRRPDRNLRQRRRSRHLLRGDRPAAGPEARDPERAEGRDAQGHREQARPPPGTREPSRRPNPHSHAGKDRPPHATHHEAQGQDPRAGPDLPRPGGHPGLLVRAIRRPDTRHAGSRTIYRRRGVRAMIRRLGAIMACLAVAAVTLPATARAGQYTVTACHADGVNNSWQSSRTNAYADAYIDCPGGVSINGRLTGGMIARNTGGPGTAPRYSAASVFFDAPAGARIVRVTGQVNQNSTGGWTAGIRDMTIGRWLWCGTGCLSTFGIWPNIDIGGLSTGRIAAVVLCDVSTCARDGVHALAALRNVNVVVGEDSPPSLAFGGGSLVAGSWRRGVQDVAVYASDGIGVRRTDILADGAVWQRSNRMCDVTRAVPCPNGVDSFRVQTRDLSDGFHLVKAVAVDSAGNPAEVARRIAIDNTAPVRPSALSVDGGTGWRSANSFRLRWANPRESAAPIAGASISCPAVNPAPQLRCTTTTRPGSGLNSVDGIRVPGPGQWRTRLWLHDAAGNQDPTKHLETILRFDDRAPTLSFVAPTPAQPAVVRIRAHDVGSGLATREILLRRRGSRDWRSLPVVTEKRGFAAIIDDERLADGIYELRARAVDLAGNDRSTDRWADGKLAVLVLPLRIKTSLRVGKRKRVRARGARGKRRYRVVLIEKPKSRYGRTILLRGRLTSPGGNPLVGRNVDVLEQTRLPAAPWRPIATLRTSKTGRFSFRALRGPSRTLRFRFNGTDTIRGRTAIVRLGVRAVSSMSVDRDRVVNGEGVTFRGRLRGRPVPLSGKLIEVQARARGRWLTFGTTRAHARTGRWSMPYRFSATRGTVRYQFRVRVPKESGYPYEAGKSRSITVMVRGL